MLGFSSGDALLERYYSFFSYLLVFASASKKIGIKMGKMGIAFFVKTFSR